MTDLILLIPLRELGVYTKNTIPSIVIDDKRGSTCSEYLRSFTTLLNFEERPDVKSAYVRQRVTVGKTIQPYIFRGLIADQPLSPRRLYIGNLL